MNRCKCQLPEGVTIRPDGRYPLDPCIYKLKEEHRNVTVFIDQCVNCGHISLSWVATEDTEHIIHEELEEESND